MFCVNTITFKARDESEIKRTAHIIESLIALNAFNPQSDLILLRDKVSRTEHICPPLLAIHYKQKQKSTNSK